LPFSGKIEKRGEMITKHYNIENDHIKGNLNGNIKIITKNDTADDNKICNIKTIKNDAI
jgi:hypothetical protein